MRPLACVVVLVVLVVSTCATAPLRSAPFLQRESQLQGLHDYYKYISDSSVALPARSRGFSRTLAELQVSLSVPIAGKDDNATKAALWELYGHAGGANWIWSDSESPSQGKWDNETSYCMWQGVSCCYRINGELIAAVDTGSEGVGLQDVRDPLVMLRLASGITPGARPSARLDFETSFVLSCHKPQAVVSLRLAGMNLNGYLPESLGTISLTTLDVSWNPNLRGMLPESFQTSSLSVLSIAGTALSCAPEQYDDSDGHIAQSYRHNDLSALPPGCAAIVSSGIEPKEVRAYFMSGAIWVVCPTFQLPRAKLPLTMQYTHAMGCKCPASYSIRIVSRKAGEFEILCIEPGVVWMLVTGAVTGLLAAFLAFKLVTIVMLNKLRFKNQYMHWVKENWLPGTIKLPWNEPAEGVMNKDERTGQALYKVCWVMCRAEGTDKLFEALSEDVVTGAVRTYHAACRKYLKKYHGYVVHTEDDAYFLVAFHEIVDALTWALVTQNALLAASWPASLDAIPETQRVVQKQSQGEQTLFAGLRIAMAMKVAVPKTVTQHAGKMYCTGPHMEALCQLADVSNGTQVMTDHQMMQGDMEMLGHMMDLASHRMRRGFPLARSRRNLAAKYAPGEAETMQSFLTRLHAPASEECLGVSAAANDASESSTKPMIIDMGIHVMSERFQANLMQISTEMMMPQAALATTQSGHVVDKLGKGFFEAPMALQAYTRDANGERLPNRHVVLVFCTMQGYNELFSHEEKLAQHTLVLYCASVRQTLDKVGGYECQELEGTFMLAFSEAQEAINFALVLQLMMLQAPWDPEILKLPPTEEVRGPDNLLLFRGARVKLGIYRGKPETVVPHTSTGRADYFGTMVNRAARMMAASQGGQVLVQHDIIELVRKSYMASSHNTEMWKMEGVLSPNELLVSCGAQQKIKVMANPEKAVRQSRNFEKHNSKRGSSKVSLKGHNSKDRSDRSITGAESIASTSSSPSKIRAAEPGDKDGWADDKQPAATGSGVVAADLAALAASSCSPDRCHAYLHDIEFHDMGKYSFKGIVGQYDVLQVNTASIAGRSIHFPTELPPGKAKKISQGKGHIETVQAVLISPVLVVQELVHHRTYRMRDADASTH